MEYGQFSYDYAGVDKKTCAGHIERIGSYRVFLRDMVERAQAGGEIAYTAPESSLLLPFDARLLGRVNDAAKRVRTPRLKYVIVVGIGGSALGTQAVYDACRPSAALRTDAAPRIIIFDTASERKLVDFFHLISERVASKDEFVVNVVSKSGKTVETIANFEALFAYLTKRFGDISDRVVVTTDDESPLHRTALERGFSTLSIPHPVGGRYSVFSAVGLFPLMLAGIDIPALLEGARGAAGFAAEPSEKNSALQSAGILMAHYAEGIRIHNTFLFAPEMRGVGDWYAQLVGESLGKEKDMEGNIVHAGITPMTSIGTTDLHSLAQLYLGGPRDKFTTFVFGTAPLRERKGVVLPDERVLPDSGFHLAGKCVGEVFSAIFEGVRETYIEHELPFTVFDIRVIDEFSLGWLMQGKMLEVMYLAKMMNVNAFDQPNVEVYKARARERLRGGE